MWITSNYLSSNRVGIASLFASTFFVGIWSGWSMDGYGGMDMVDAEEEQGIFKIRCEALILNFPWVFLRFLSAAVFIGIFLEGKIIRA